MLLECGSLRLYSRCVGGAFLGVPWGSLVAFSADPLGSTLVARRVGGACRLELLLLEFRKSLVRDSLCLPLLEDAVAVVRLWRKLCASALH